MNATTLEAISISDFRSISGTIVLPLAAPIVLLYGPNGAGKTSVMSALELVLTGQIADVQKADQKHLVHHGAKSASLDLATSAGPVSVRIDQSTSDWVGHLDKQDARFFSERCYLAQRTLGQLLEIYQSTDKQKDSPLMRFVKDLLGLDELDALIDGLESVKDIRNLRNLVPEYRQAEQDIDARRQGLAESSIKLQEISSNAKAARQRIAENLDKLNAPANVDSDAGPRTVEKWLEKTDEANALSQLVVRHDELKALRRRWAQLEKHDAAKASLLAETNDREARDASNSWWTSHGAALEAALDDLRRDLPGTASAVASADPASVHKEALEEIATELQRSRSAISSDERSGIELQRLDDAIQAAQARIAVIDEQLASAELVSTTRDLGSALAALVPHLHAEDCPVCGRDYSEVSTEPLATRLAMRVSELGERAERLHGFATARLEAVGDLASSQDARSVLASRRMDPAQKTTTEAKIGRFEEVQQRLVDLNAGVAEGAKVIRRAVETERSRVRAHEQDQASGELRAAISALSASLGLPVNDATTPLEGTISTLEDHLSSQITGIEARQLARQTTRAHTLELTELTRAQQDLEASIEQGKTALAQVERAVGSFTSQRTIIKKLRDDGEASRAKIVEQVFNSSLNRMWRDLFVRLAPDEPFVPAFHVPKSPGERVSAKFETLHRDGKPGGSPAAMLSAGNLNTAALTLFLALHLSAEPRLPWILLDDPVQSMDEVHVSQFAAVLRSLSREHGRQIVIAVHELALFEYLRLELSPGQPGERLAAVELSRSIDGASLAQSTPFEYEEDTALTAA